METQSDFSDLLQAFNDAGVKYLVVGGHAVAMHGHPRATKDLNVFIEPSRDNARRAYAALEAFGAPLDRLSVADLCDPDIIFQIGVPPLRIDVITSVSGVTFDEAWASRAHAAYGLVPISIIGRAALLANKAAAGRLQELADIDALRGTSTP